LEPRIHIKAGAAILSWHEKGRHRQVGPRNLANRANVWRMFDPAWRTRASKEIRQPSNLRVLVVRREPNIVIANST